MCVSGSGRAPGRRSRPGPPNTSVHEGGVAGARYARGGAGGGRMTGNLPAALDRLVGRDAELAALARLRARLVTLHGPGGAGKTRLATEFATRAGERFPGGAWLVELAAVTDPALVTQSVAATLRVSEQRGRPLPDTVADALFGPKTLLVLDNCEHLVDACARLVVSLLDRCPELTVLATSREVLDVPGETVVRVGALAPSDAVELFAERAGTARRGFR